MQPMLLHYCDICSHCTPVPFSASVFSQIQTCFHCGTASSGLRQPPHQSDSQEEDPKMQQDQEELARMFSQNMSLDQQAPPQMIQPEPVPVVEDQQQEPRVWASAHYYHAAHVPKARSEPCMELSELEATLIRNSIDPTSLIPSQVSLYQNAPSDQRLRLLELWRISPPTYNDRELVQEMGGRWSETNLQQEEHLAKLRYEKLMQEREQQQRNNNYVAIADGLSDGQMTDGESMADDPSPAIHALQRPRSSDDLRGAAEPYIVSGYEFLAKRDYDDSASSLKEIHYNQAIDPIYNSVGGGCLWGGKPDVQGMENDYGAFAQMREYEAMNQPAIHEFDVEMAM